ncbi:MAG TPA: tRNA (adenosine(37)-N6)-threonylcarbamoyltransferase complex ATPase subunit type 1 TsaE [Deltaproteobacteria bacterium]|nr:tRNA (adenosine(37)-N6)-threonylcarbamoyltransferase complex ATPase subunit type 1 TsaE [Deltaproteobacteria bacterium]
MERTLLSCRTEDTIEIGAVIGRALQKGQVIALIGDLGSGKTCITQGIARGLDVPDSYYVTSPTFTLINEYPGRITLYHLDVYRLSGSQDLGDMGYEEYFYGDGVIVIEWAEKILDVLPMGSIIIYMTYIDEYRREIIISGAANSVTKIVKELDKGGFR